jgi:uncharacterized protein (UPF0332 family)
MASASERDLHFVSELRIQRISDFKAGISLVARTGYPLDDLLSRVALDRLTLGGALHREARAALQRKPHSFRNAISRAYYSMYQTFRGVVFLVSKGDDYEKHSELPQHLPGDFPAVGYWENALKIARLERNRADYEPYPRSDAAFKTQAETIYRNSHKLRGVARTYLRGKGLKV